MKPVLLLIAYCLLPTAYCQLSAAYPQGYFRNPLGIPILLAGNFGECRPGHFHSGLDIKTGGHENEPVYAAADGYISRVKMDAGGFGHGLYITHPNGCTTLYAHLNDFVPAVQAFIRKQQYAQESWSVDLNFPPGQFPVKKGQQIAWSGNTGGSTAPHLHFEIRNTATEHPLNPQLFGFEVKDTRAPVPLRLAVYGYPQGVHSDMPALYKLSAEKDRYRPNNDTIYVRSGPTGLAVEANDFMDGSENTLAPLSIAWYQDEQLLGAIRLDDIGYDETRYINAYTDYSMYFREKIWLQRLFRLWGNRLTRIYSSLSNSGFAVIEDSSYHAIRIEMQDVTGNISTVRFVLAGKGKQFSMMSSSTLLLTYPDSDYINDHSTTHSFYLDKTQFYTDIAGRDIYQPSNGVLHLFSPDIPVHHAFDLRLKFPGVVAFSERDNVVMMYSDGKETSGRAASVAERGFYKASVRAFGDYWLAIDTTAPIIIGKGTLTNNRVTFKATDAVTSIKKFRGELDGKWILFEQHGSNWFYEVDDHCSKGPHILAIKVADENGNTAVKRYSFTR